MEISARKIEVLMVNCGLTLSQLAEVSGLKRATLTNIRRRGSCQIKTAGKLCAALGCTAADIMPDELREA